MFSNFNYTVHVHTLVILHICEISVWHNIKDQDIGNYNFACCFVWVWNLVADIAVGKEAVGVWEHGVEENIWTEEGWGNEGLEEIS